jgi:phosphoadenosine phosphosulfate reductase
LDNTFGAAEEVGGGKIMLREDTLFGYVDKVAISISRLQEFEPKEGYYLAFSGGKDSVVLLSLAKAAGVKFDAHYSLTTVDPPELVYFIWDNFPEVKTEFPRETMWQLIRKKKMLPTRRARYCCGVLKERGGEGRYVLTGIRWRESAHRSNRKMNEACTKAGKVFLHPIIDWTTAEIWQYIRENNLPYCKLYDEGFKRLGCVMCPMARGKGREIAAIRWPKIVKSYQEAAKVIFEFRKKRPNCRWQSWEEMWAWWMELPPVAENLKGGR